MRCLSESPVDFLSLSCESLGLPYGYPVVFGGPFAMLGALFMWAFGMGSDGAYTLSSASFLGIALFSGYALIRRLGAGRAVAMGAAVTYLVSPTILGLQGFGGTFFGFALLPAYALADVLMIEALAKRRWATVAVAFVPFAGVKVFALFMDGYSFVAAGLISLALWAEWTLRKQRISKVRRFAGPGLLLGANLCAVAVYTAYESSDYGKPALPIFRALGLDLITLVSPSEFLWLAKEAGWAVNRSGLWGDGSNIHYNYIGFVCLALAMIALLSKATSRRTVALAIAGVVALVLSFGPALKLNEAGPPADGFPPSHASYVMQEGEALELPWSGLFTSVPGLDSMRATYRWFGVTRFVLIVLAALGASVLLGKGRVMQWTGAVLAILAVVELSPAFLRHASAYQSRRAQMEAFTEQVEPELVGASDVGDRVFFLNYDGSHNDWLVNYLAPAAGLSTYNAGGDKNYVLAAQRWPEEVVALAGSEVSSDDVHRALRSGRVDAVIVPFFHLRQDAYSWPPSSEKRVSIKEQYSEILGDSGLEVDTGEWLAVVTLGSSLDGGSTLSALE